MLLPAQVAPFLQHDDPIVREHAKRYFHDAYDFGPVTADDYWAVIDRLGENDSTLGFASNLGGVPQTEASFRRLLRSLASSAVENFEFHYQHTVRDIDLRILTQYRDEILACSQLLPHVREHLELRLSLIDQPPAAAWDRLMQHGKELAGSYAFNFNASLSDALLEAAARGQEEVCRQAMLILDDPQAQVDWREIFAVRVLGLARYHPAIDALVEKLAIDADILRDQANRALVRIGTPQVIERLVAFYPGKPWHVRLFSHAPLADIKRPESEDALLKLLAVELALEEDPPDDEGGPLTDTILIDLTQLESLAGLEQSRRLIEDFPNDPEVMDLQECLLAAAIMNGVKLPEETKWRKRLKRRDARSAAPLSSDPFFQKMRDNWRKTGISEPPSPPKPKNSPEPAPGPVSLAAPDDQDVVQRIRNSAPKVGRNEPCPCGSGKKYKKCCGK